MVELLLENGADAYATEDSGNNPLMCACMFNRVDNVKLWLNKFPDWNLEARNTVVGATALGLAVYAGPFRLDLTKLLLKRGADTKIFSHSGSSILLASCDNEDACPNVVRLILRHVNGAVFLNYKRTATTMKWKTINAVARIAKCTMCHIRSSDRSIMVSI